MVIDEDIRRKVVALTALAASMVASAAAIEEKEISK